MDELRVVRREDQSLIVATESGDEYRLVVDSSVLAELRHLARQATGGARINPREIQSLVRAGKSRAEIIELTGADESDIERYEEPVLAERRFILSSAQAVAVRTSPTEQNEEQFGTVIAERLIGLVAQDAQWSSWRDEEAGWMISLDFESHDVAHRAVWSFEHRKGLLSPLNPDAVSLSKQGDVGDRLIPKLRAVDASESKDRFDSDAFHRDELHALDPQPESTGDPAPETETQPSEDAAPAMSPGTEAAVRAGHPSTASIPIIRPEDEFARRREIDQRAIKTPQPEQHDLGQTADLLDALRRRRGAREEIRPAAPETHTAEPEAQAPAQPVPLRGLGDWRDESEPSPRTSDTAEPDAPRTVAPEPEQKPAETPKRGKGRASIPSWDDILFGTRSEEDPS